MQWRSVSMPPLSAKLVVKTAVEQDLSRQPIPQRSKHCLTVFTGIDCNDTPHCSVHVVAFDQSL